MIETLDSLQIIQKSPDEDDYETAMCTACEAILLKDQAWSDRLSQHADFELFCRACYEGKLKNHMLVAKGGMS